ncbi:Helicase protein MOM1 [Apostasia shenzhenica]|uniref:Helicase protein MOM1 n=1 Tax=Apostasia shenzhenica TaxID=1088818 RepID=A0A2I0AX96_9ASPA|nr:Helicase protein MOM1 [Apostasia shenzhenica]
MCYVAYERKADSSKFLEYWVPVPLSNVQLEEYCETLISNSDVLRSNSRSDLVGTIHDVLMATKRCCDHPYLVDGELRNSLTKGLQGMDYFNAEVHASGKLLLLEKILQEMKGRGLRVVIIYQSVGGPVKISLGDILDDFLQQRFGVDSYERIETRLIMSKKLTAQNMFNDRKTGRFVFLIESRACLPSVKLYSVDVVILFNSDWNPFSDVRGLQKITFQPQSTSIRVFRLYTSFTVEEKLLILAKHDTPIESNIQSTSRNVAHSLLAWGASNLFQKLDGFHLNARTTCISVTSSDVVNLLNDVTSEILEEVHGEAQTNRKVPCFLNKVSRSGASYSKSIVLVGEKEGVLVPDKDIPSFWSSLLEGRHPKWLYISKPSQRIRRKIYNLDESMNVHEAENDEVKKRRKINSIGDPFTSVTCSQERRDAVKDAISETRKSHLLESQPWEPKLEEQRTLLMLLRPELAKLCDILNLQGTVKSMAEEFLEYIMNNHDVSSKQVPVLQALKISLCWRAASMLRHNLDRLESLALARRHLDYECTEHEAFSVYSRLRILKEKFPCQAVVLKDVKAHNTLNSHPEKADAAKEALHGRDTEVAASDTPDLGVTERVSDGKFQTNQESDAVLQTNEKFQSDIRSSKDQLYDRLRDLIDKVCIRRSKELAQVHQAELVQYESQMNEEKWKLENAHNLDVELVRSIHTDATVIKDKVMLLTLQFSRKMGRFHRHVKQQREKLICMQFDMKINEQDLKKKWLENAKAGQLEGSFNDVPLPVTGFMAENMKETSELAITCSSGITVLSTVGSSDQTNTYVDGAPTGTSNGLEERCPIQSNIENLMLEPEALASQPGTLDYLATTTQNRVVEKSGTPFELEDVLPMDIEVPAHQPEFPNPLSGVPDDLITDSIMLPDKNAENGGPTIAAASRNNQELSSFPEVTIPISQATTLSLQDEPSPNGATALEPTLHLLPQTEHDVRVPPASNPEDLACLRANCSSEQHEVPEQQAFLADSIRGEQLNEQNNVPPFDSMDDPPPQRLPSETLRSTDIQSDPRNQFSQSFPSMGWVPPQAICADPFQNELYRIHKQDDSCTKKHDEKKIQLQLEYEEEMAKVRRKYDTLLQDAERDYLREKQIIVSIYDKVLLHKVLAEELRVKFYCNKEGTSSFQGSNQNLIQQLQASASLSQPQLAVRPSSAPPPVPSLTATAHPQVLTTNQLSTSSFLTTSRPSNPPPALATFQSTGPSCQSSPLLSSNIARGSSPRAILPIGRAPAPHLQRFRPHVAVPALNSPLSAFGPVTAPVPFIPLSNVVSSLPTAFPPIQSSFSHGQLPQFIVADLLDSLPSSLASTMTNSRPIASSDFIYLSDDE